MVKSCAWLSWICPGTIDRYNRRCWFGLRGFRRGLRSLRRNCDGRRHGRLVNVVPAHQHDPHQHECQEEPCLRCQFLVGHYGRDRRSLSDRVEASLMERMAARQSAQAHADALPHTMLFDGVLHIFRTGRMKTARRGKQGRDHELVTPNEPGSDRARQAYFPLQCLLQCSITFLRARSSSVKGAASAVRRGLITISHWGLRFVRCRRNASRIRRLMRFRTTLPPIALGTVRPKRGLQPLPSSRARQKAANSGPETRLPWSYTFRKSAVRRARFTWEPTGGQRGASPPARLAGFGVADGLLVAYGQLVTAASPAARQHGPSVLGLHALTKSVDLRALAIVRLKSTFRHIGLARSSPKAKAPLSIGRL